MLFDVVRDRLKSGRFRASRRPLLFPTILLLIALLDELIYGAREAAWPLIRTELELSYAELGLLISVPGMIGSLVEPFLGMFGDVRRRLVVIGGGLVYSAALLIVAGATDFSLLLVAFVLLSPAGGAFVSLAQATLVDLVPRRRDQMMARWNLAGTLGVLLGPLALGALVARGGSWRFYFLGAALLSLILVAAAWRQPFGSAAPGEVRAGIRAGFVGAWQALRSRAVLRYLVLLGASDLLLDLLLGFLALYFVDIVGLTPELAGGAVALSSAAALVGDLLMIPLLARLPGTRYLRYSAAGMLLLYPAFLLVPSLWAKLLFLGLMGVIKAGWYPVLKGQLYGTLPGRSGVVMAVSSATDLVAGLIPILLGLVAERFGLRVMMWLLAIAPVVLLLGLRRDK